MTDPLEQFRRAAKTLKSRYETGDADARARLKAHPPRSAGDLKHADFLHVIAQENSFASWPAMKDAIETMGLDRATKVQRLKIALFHGQTGVVQRLISNTPDLAAGHFGLLCALLDVQSVWAMLKKDPTLAAKMAGPVQPLVHLCKSRMFSVWPERADDAVAIADMLVANGADVNAGTVENGAPLSPLYWALGHAGNMPLAEWLLENGANPNDGESLYHSTELGHADGVRLLLTHGADPKKTNALPRAMDFDNAEMVELLLKAGADPNEGTDAWTVGSGVQRGVPVLHQAARRMNSGAVLDLLLEYGADPTATWNGHSAYAFSRVFGNHALCKRIEAHGSVSELTEIETHLAAAATGKPVEGFIDPAKIPDAYRNILREVLHLPGKLPHLKALVAIGLEWDRPDGEGITPVQAAGWVGLPDVLAYFLKLDPDLSHVNNYGGTLLSTIIHGSENNPNRGAADYVACLRLVLDHGVALPRKTIEMAGDDDVRRTLEDWAAAKPSQVVAHGIG
ncbi:ankyrin repeat domain-containing protein [Octadecabacter sp. 1_MG-2023]|uniref:ankyrin repeat domain-containing protein n=1 Tax=unclassified Octadecabacter TaxID=196158 RepID=UPI001C085F05|nr:MULTISPECIES: ankyrin repeat domain-containing protein [unclassified Octadecabacter]MBU2994230.1 ankyrin repeat domain-containing protein [Octadecabacter sp. B2R22]MDO6734481.1 ankyrin repeat domain-containing protein [Octadecabacter sp. 1_MG-2023]